MKALDKRRHAKYSVRHFGGLVLAGLAICTLAVAVLATFRQVYATTSSVPTGGVPISSVGDERNHIIMVHDDGIDTGFTTKASTLRQALEDAGIHIDAKDRTEPGLDEKLIAGSYQVNIYRARPVVIKDGATTLRLLTSYRTASQIAKDAGLVLHPEDKTTLELSTDPINDGAAEVLTIERATEFSFDFYGKVTTSYTMSATVGEMLKSKGIVLGRDDGLNVALTTPITNGMEIRLWRDGVQTKTEDVSVPFMTRTIEDKDQPIGYKKVQIAGVGGKRTVTYQIDMKNGREVSRKEINSVTILEPVEQVEVVGAKNNYSSSLNEWLTALRTCETNDVYTRNSGNGYYGAYQFLPSTWDNVARKIGRLDLVGVRPDLAAPADQDTMVIANTNMSAGLRTQNPGCYIKLGLSNKPPTN